jgi:predicted P-loop ATPase
MEKELLVKGEAMNASTKNTLVIEEFLLANYRFRRNQLNGKAEYQRLSDGDNASFIPLTAEAVNSIVLHAKREAVYEKGTPKSDIVEYLHSLEVPMYNPIADYLSTLPKWDGHNYVADLFSRIPGVSSEQLSYLAIWLRSAVAHWQQMDTLHGNEIVPTLIGAQGCGKTTFLRRLLPQPLRQYYLDHLNLSNKFDKEMALTNNLLVNLDELDAIRPSQHAALKQTLSKSKVNGRPIYGCSQEDRPRFASFVATTNNPHPLTDATGSRRYICLLIPKGQFIDNVGDIDYDQLYAQVLYELHEQKAPYWYNNLEVARIQELNQNFVEQKDIAELVEACFRKPEEGEPAKSMNKTQMLEIIKSDYPSLVINHSAKVHLGSALEELGYPTVTHARVSYYKVIPRKSA